MGKASFNAKSTHLKKNLEFETPNFRFSCSNLRKFCIQEDTGSMQINAPKLQSAYPIFTFNAPESVKLC